MKFAEGTCVIYKNFSGKIDFTCPSYVVISIPNQSSTPARLLVYQEDYKFIQIDTIT